MASEPFESIYIENISVGSIQESSGIFTGVNAQYHWKSYEKSNLGFGEINGCENTFVSNKSFVYDPGCFAHSVWNPKSKTETNLDKESI